MNTNLELFVLAMVRQGLATPYKLKTKAGVSLGSTVPVLTRLEKGGLVKRIGNGRSPKPKVLDYRQGGKGAGARLGRAVNEVPYRGSPLTQQNQLQRQISSLSPHQAPVAYQ